MGACLLTLLTPELYSYSTQTFEEKKNVALEVLKPWLGWLTTIDFGPVNYEQDALAHFENAKLRLVCNNTFGDSRSAWRTYHIVIAEPTTTTTAAAAADQLIGGNHDAV
jgi:hypothetical protein